MINVGDAIGVIYDKRTSNGNKVWCLIEDKVRKVVSGTRGTKIHTKRFCPLEIEEIESNTELLEHKTDLILVREPCLLTDEIRERFSVWIKTQNTCT